jgi:transposase
MSSQFKVEVHTHEKRLNALRARSQKHYLDDGPETFFHLLHAARAQGHHGLVEFGLTELERLYSEIATLRQQVSNEQGANQEKE